MYDVVIIGGGPGGIYSSIVCSLQHLDCCVIEGTNNLGGQPISLYADKDIHDFPGQKVITGGQLINSFLDQLNNLKEHKPEIMLNTTISSINKTTDGFKITLSNNKVIETKSIIIATGLGMYQPIRLDENEIKIINHDNIFYEYDESTLKDKEVIVLGGGDSALDWANHLKEHNITNSASIIHRRNEWRAREDKINKLSTNKVNVYLNKKLVQIDKNELIMIDNDTNEQTKLHFDKLLVQYGTQLNANSITTCFKDIEIKTNRKILVDLNCKTNQDFIYAIGSATEYDCAPNMILNACADATRAIYHLRKKVKE